MREFETGATRDDDSAKHDFEGFLSPAALVRFAEFMTDHRVQADGQLRDSDNWQKGIPVAAYMKSLLRHVVSVWLIHRGQEAYDEKGNRLTLESELCAVLFNTQGYLHELVKDEMYDAHLDDVRAEFPENFE